jgi:hypothetical protein
MVQKNDFYRKTLDEFFRGKDAAFEMAKIIKYDNERLVARVYTLTSLQYQDDVPVLFPSMHMNSGIISPPAVSSTAMLIWGPDRQPFLLPVQYNLPNVVVENGLRKINASPGFEDQLRTLQNVQQGEHLLRSIGGAYVFLKNLGDVEIGTPGMNLLLLTEKDGALVIDNERIKADIGNSHFYFGPASMDSNADSRTHLHFSLGEVADRSEQLPKDMEDDDLIQDLLSDNIDSIEVEEPPKIFERQMGHVLNEQGIAEKDTVDGSELFAKETMIKGANTKIKTVSKMGREVITTTGQGVETEIVTSSGEVTVTQRRIVEGKFGLDTTMIGITRDGDIICEKDGKRFDLFRMLEWFYEERT